MSEPKISRQLAWRRKMKAIGLCPQCGANYAKVGCVNCRECLAKDRLRVRENRRNSSIDSQRTTA